MKKICVIAVCLTVSGFLFAQSPNIRVGIKAGVNVSRLNVENGGDFDSRASFNAGGLAHIHVTRHFAVQPELYYSAQGGKKGDQTMMLNYLNLPILAQYMTGSGFRLETGPQFGVLLAAQSKTGHLKVDVKDQFKAADFSWAVGVGYQIPGSGLGFDARYNFGISDINDVNSNTIHNGVFSIGLFYQFASTTAKL